VIRSTEKFLVWILLLLALACSANAPSVYTDPRNQALVLALQSHLKKDVTDIPARYELVAVFLEELFFDKAESELRQIIRQDKNEIDAYHLLALVLIQGPKSDYLQAISLLEAGLRLAPSRTDTHLALALAYAQLGRNDKATAECKFILNNSSNIQEEATVYLILSTLNPDRQAEYLKKAMALDTSVVDSEQPITVPIYIGRRSFHEFSTHPAWRVRLRNLDSALGGDSRHRP
jgi:tetratricopeptide (TPR) repeat protein